MQCRLQGHLIAHLQRLGDLDHQRIQLCGKHPPIPLRGGNGVIAYLDQARQSLVRVGVIDANTFRAPDLDDEIEILGHVFGCRGKGIVECLVTQGKRQLTQLVIEQVIHFRQGGPVNGEGTQQQCEGNGAQQGDKELAADGFHEGLGMR